MGDNGDGHLALLLGGSGGLSLSQTLTSAEAPSPTGLSFGGVSDGLLDFYVSTAGHEAAMNLAFNLSGGPAEGGGGGGVSILVGATPTDSSSAGALSQATSGSVQQVAQLLSLSGTTLDLAATLLTVSVVEIEPGGGTPATGGSTGPGQGSGRSSGPASNPGDEPDEEAGQAVEESEATAERAPAWERLAIGLDRSWERTRAAIRKLDGQSPEAEPRNAPAPTAVGPQPKPTVQAPARPETPSASATAAPPAPEAASSIRRPEDTGRAVEAALMDLGAAREADESMGRWSSSSPQDRTHAEDGDLTHVLVASVASAAFAGTGWALDRRRPPHRGTVPIGLRR